MFGLKGNKDKKPKKAIFKIPQREVLLSLAAFLIVIFGFFLITAVDSLASYDKDNPIEYDEEKLVDIYRSYMAPTGEETTGWGSWYSGENKNMYLPSENDGSYLIDADRTGFTSFEFKTSKMIWHDQGIKHMIVTTPMDLKLVSFMVFGAADSGLSVLEFKFVQTSPGVWESDFSTADQLILKKYATGNFKFVWPSTESSPAAGLVEFSFEMYDHPIPVYYAEILWVVYAALLGVVAIFSTKWLNHDTIPNAIEKSVNSAKDWNASRKKKKQNKGGW